MSHKSDQITRAGLERIREYCIGRKCDDCKIRIYCKELNNIIYCPISWSNENITEILKMTRNYMEKTFIKSLEQIVEQEGECHGVECVHCPFLGYYNEPEECPTSLLRHTNDPSEKAETAQMLLEYYKGERENE